ncbi:VOC family protein [Planctomyces sp. SH-PL62]|uniref:VOC family protein n=1 Tax=Planctomyces sp. SH-PL62 TaxID=1636152 RepID=UPI00078DFE90|nr:VOC family protein [Planctomyces sp. SH-PL62]AMV37554.1 Glyoxalase-like domain protein [Planctomyces sp. SH-PL62]
MARLEHFAIYAADLEALKDFYVRTMGLKVARVGGGSPPGGYFLADDHGGAIEIIARPADESNARQRWVCHLAFWVDDVPAKQAELEKLGIVFETDTAAFDDEIKTSFFHDPEGNRCQLVWRREPLTG